jgi:DNA-binding NtrC family response regulator
MHSLLPLPHYFPYGHQVLLMEPNHLARAEAEALLKEYSYIVTVCSDAAEAAAHLTQQHAVDVLLLNAKCLQQRSCEITTLIAAAKHLPLVLMSETSDPSQVMLGIRLGSVDFLEMPLSPLKLKNLWQHTVSTTVCLCLFLKGKGSSRAHAHSYTGTSPDWPCQAADKLFGSPRGSARM